MLEELLRAGMNVARFNFSHGSHEYHQARLPPLGGSGSMRRWRQLARASASRLCQRARTHGTDAAGRAQETLDNLRQAQANTRIMCAVLLDTKGPEIRTGTLKDGKPVTYEAGSEVTLTTDYNAVGDSRTIAIRQASARSACTLAPN